MKKINVLIFSLVLLGFSFYGLSTSSYYVQLLFNLNVLFMYARIGFVAVLLTYVFIPSIRLYTTRSLLYTSGVLLIILGVTSVVSPTLMGHSGTYILLGDSGSAVEGGILAVVLSAELSAKRSRFMSKSFYYMRSLFISVPNKIPTYTPKPILTRTLKTQPLFKTALMLNR